MLKRRVRSIIASVVESRTGYQSVGGVTFGRDIRGIDSVSFGGNNLIHSGTIFSGAVTIGYASTVGANCRISGPVVVGNWCQLAPNVSLIGSNHPTTLISTYVNSRLLEGVVGSLSKQEPVSIGNDVWLGDGSIVLPGTHIGTGAVIGAGAVVAKDVPPYAIAVGNPARTVRLRLPDEIVELVLATRWWELTSEELRQHSDIFELDLANLTDTERAQLEEFADQRNEPTMRL